MQSLYGLGWQTQPTRYSKLVASFTIRNLEEAAKRTLKIRAAIHGRSMEEAREILERAAPKNQ